MDPLKSITWEQLTTIVGAAILFFTTAIGALCLAIKNLSPKIKEALEAIDSITRKQEAHKEVLENLADASPKPTAALLKPLETEAKNNP